MGDFFPIEVRCGDAVSSKVLQNVSFSGCGGFSKISYGFSFARMLQSYLSILTMWINLMHFFYRGLLLKGRSLRIQCIGKIDGRSMTGRISICFDHAQSSASIPSTFRSLTAIRAIFLILPNQNILYLRPPLTSSTESDPITVCAKTDAKRILMEFEGLLSPSFLAFKCHFGPFL